MCCQIPQDNVSLDTARSGMCCLELCHYRVMLDSDRPTIARCMPRRPSDMRVSRDQQGGRGEFPARGTKAWALGRARAEEWITALGAWPAGHAMLGEKLRVCSSIVLRII